MAVRIEAQVQMEKTALLMYHSVLLLSIIQWRKLTEIVEEKNLLLLKEVKVVVIGISKAQPTRP